MPRTRTVVEKGFKGAAYPLAMILHLQMYTRQLGCPEFEDLKRFIRHQCEIYLDVNQTTKQQKDQGLEIVKKVQEGRQQYFDKSLSDIDIRLRRLWKYIVTSHAEARRQRSAKLTQKQRKTTNSKKPTTRARTDKENLDPPNKQVSIGPMKTARLAILANSNQAETHSNSSESVTETPSSAIDVDLPAVESITTTGENSSSFGQSVWEVTMTAPEGRYRNDFDDRASTRPAMNANAIEVPRFRLRRTLGESFVSVLGLDDSEEHREEFEAIKCHLRNFSNARLDPFKSAWLQHEMIDKAMEDLQMEWPDLFSHHVPGAEDRLCFARAYLLHYYSCSSVRTRAQKQQSEVMVPLHQPGRKKFKPSLGSSTLTPLTQSAPPGLDRVESTKIVESSIPQESTQEPVSTPPTIYSAPQSSPSIMPPSTLSLNSSPFTSPPASHSGMGQSFCESFSTSCQPPRVEPSLAEAVPSKELTTGQASNLVEYTRIAVEAAPGTLDRQSPPAITPASEDSEPPLTPSLSTSVGFTSPAGIDQNVFSFLCSCQPSLTHLAGVFADVGCSTHQHLFAMSCSPRTEERRYLLLKDVFKGRGVTEMEFMIIERQLDFVGWIPDREVVG